MTRKHTIKKNEKKITHRSRATAQRNAEKLAASQ